MGNADRQTRKGDTGGTPTGGTKGSGVNMGGTEGRRAETGGTTQGGRTKAGGQWGARGNPGGRGKAAAGATGGREARARGDHTGDEETDGGTDRGGEEEADSWTGPDQTGAAGPTGIHQVTAGESKGASLQTPAFTHGRKQLPGKDTEESNIKSKIWIHIGEHMFLPKAGKLFKISI
nr:keratin, type I cytoskeletal 9-like isoform X2 [Paramormyrops kingsleyae]